MDAYDFYHDDEYDDYDVDDVCCELCGCCCEAGEGCRWDEPVTLEERRAMGDDMLYPTYNIFGEWEN